MPNEISVQIAELSALSTEQLRQRWRELMDSEPPACHREFLVRRLAYRLQEIAYGGIPEETRAQLRSLVREYGDDLLYANSRRQQVPRRNLPLTGTRLIKDWQGKRYEVIAGPDGYIFAGRRFRSLTAITKEITGTHWNGPAFFGLRNVAEEARR